MTITQTPRPSDRTRAARTWVTITFSDGKTESTSYPTASMAHVYARSMADFTPMYAAEWDLPRHVVGIVVI